MRVVGGTRSSPGGAKETEMERVTRPQRIGLTISTLKSQRPFVLR